MKLKSLKFGLIALALFTVSLSQAQEENKTEAEKKVAKAELFKTMDANNDGVISNDEFEPMKARKEQMEKRKEKNIEEHFKKMDTDNNGMVSLKEFKAAAEARKAKKGEKRKMRKKRMRS